MSTAEDHKEAQVYELGYLILPSVAEDNLPDMVTRLKSIISKAGGAELASEDPFKIDLAYKMSKAVGARKYVVQDAYIGWVKFEVTPEAVPGIDTEVKRMDEVLRHLLIKVPRDSSFTFASARQALEAEAPAEVLTEPQTEPQAKPEAAPEESEK